MRQSAAWAWPARLRGRLRGLPRARSMKSSGKAAACLSASGCPAGRPAARLGGGAAVPGPWRPVAFAGLDPIGDRSASATTTRAKPPARGNASVRVHRHGRQAEAAAGQRGEGLGVVGRSWHGSRIRNYCLAGATGLRSSSTLGHASPSRLVRRFSIPLGIRGIHAPTTGMLSSAST
jgi:hypothetical protein